MGCLRSRRHLFAPAGAKLGFNLANSLVEATFDLRNIPAATKVSGLVEMIEIRTKLEQKLVGKSMTHRKTDFAHVSVRLQDYCVFKPSFREPVPSERGIKVACSAS